MKAKSFFGSKTVWAGLITSAISFIDQASPILPEWAREYGLAIVGILMIILRLTSKEPIKGFEPEPARYVPVVLALALVGGVASSPRAQDPEPFSLKASVNTKDWTLTPYVAYRAGTLENLLGLGDFEVWSQVGADVQSGNLVLGGAVARPFRVARNLDFYLGLESTIQSGRPIRFGLVIGFQILPSR